jgi:hypothetical protein
MFQVNSVVEVTGRAFRGAHKMTVTSAPSNTSIVVAHGPYEYEFRGGRRNADGSYSFRERFCGATVRVKETK